GQRHVAEQLGQSLGPAETYVTLERAAVLSGVTPERIVNLARRALVRYRGSSRDPLISLEQVVKLGTIDPTALPKASHKKLASNDHRPPEFDWNRVIAGHVLEQVAKLPPSSVQSIVTSPPFWGQRVYADETTFTWADGDRA